MMLKTMFTVMTAFLSLAAQATSFSTEGNAIRCTAVANLNGSRALFIGEMDGAVSCYTPSGEKLWRNPSLESAILFEILAADVDGDGRDDLLAASGDGHISCWDSTGSLRWRFAPNHKVRFSEIAVLGEGKDIQIFAGGNDRVVYKLNAEGELLTSASVSGVIRCLMTGRFLSKQEASLFVMTYKNDKFRWEFFGFLDPMTLTVQKSLNYKEAPSKEWSGFMVTDVIATDLDRDGRDDLFFGGNIQESCFCFKGINGEFDEFLTFNSFDNNETKNERQRYGHLTGISLQPLRDELMIQYGRRVYVFDLNGTLLHRSGSIRDGFSVSDLQMDPVDKKIYAVGSVSGGNDVYVYDLTQPDWWAMEKSWVGRMAEVQANLDSLYQQVLKFTPPVYQSVAQKPWVMISGPKVSAAVKQLSGNTIVEVVQYTRTEDYDRSEITEVIGKIGNKRDKRKPYKLTRKEIVQKARQCEQSNTPFVLWAGHGTDPFYCSIETLEAVADAAPETFYGFLYAEMHDPESPRVNYWLERYLPRLATACRKNGTAKIYFRFKNVFWATNVQMDGWKEAFFSGQYSDVLVPAAEDTTSRTQDINFVGRVGMFAGGAIHDFAFRLIDDNPTSWRPLSPGTQRSASPYVRNGVLCAAYGARYAILFGGALKKPGLDLLYAMMASGALPVVQKEDIASIGSWHLMQEIDRDWHHSIDDHHTIDRYTPDDDNAVLSVAQIQWAGASLPEYDLSRVALGVTYRWTNYMPLLPHGMVPIGPVDYASLLEKKGMPFAVSNGKVGYKNGQTVAAKRFGPIMAKTVEAGAKRLPILVSGASWSAIRLDETHYRVVMMDPHYLDPRNCPAQLLFQGMQPKRVVDILSNEKLLVSNGIVHLVVPAGSLRFVDVEF